MDQDTLKLAAMMSMKGSTINRFSLPLGCRDIRPLYANFLINYSHCLHSTLIHLVVCRVQSLENQPGLLTFRFLPVMMPGEHYTPGSNGNDDTAEQGTIYP